MTKIQVNAQGKPYISSQGKALLFREVANSFVIISTNRPLATLTCGTQSYTLTGDELSHTFTVSAGTYTCTASLDGATKTGSVTVTTPAIYELTLNLSVVPSEYQEIEYVQSSGTQYIDTTFVPNDYGTRITLDAEFLYTGTSVQGVMSMWGFIGTNQSLPRWGISIYNSPISWLFTLNATMNYGSYDALRHTFEVYTSDTGDQGMAQTYLDGERVERYSINNLNLYLSNTLSGYLFARNNNGTAGNFNEGKIYRYTAEVGNTVRQDFVPCYRKSDNEVGFYDIVNGTFYSNDGTGDFIAGPDVN